MRYDRTGSLFLMINLVLKYTTSFVQLLFEDFRTVEGTIYDR